MASGLIDDTTYSQVCLFAVEYGLWRMFQRDEGYTPAIVLGHSLGEFAAAYAAGCLSLRDAIRLVATRGRLLGSLPRNEGSMVAMSASVEKVSAIISQLGLHRCSVATVNGPRMTVISGAKDEVEAVCRTMHNIAARPLKVSHAFHSPLMRAAVPDFEQALSGTRIQRPRPHGTQLVSCVTGQLADQSIEHTSHWVRHITDPVLFFDAVKEARRLGGSCFIELGPRAVLSKLAKQCIPDPGLTFAACQEPPRDDEAAWRDAIFKLRQAVGSPPPQASAKVSQLVTAPSATSSSQPPLPRLQRFPYRRTQHPLLKNRADGPDGTVVYAVPISHSLARLLKQHVVHGRVVVPGALHLELAAAAARAEHGEDMCIALENVTFVSPCFVGYEELQIERHGAQAQDALSLFCQIHIADRKFGIYWGRSTSNIESLPPNVEGFYNVYDSTAVSSSSQVPPVPSILQATEECGPISNPYTVYQHFERKGLPYGPHFRTLTGIAGSRTHALASLQLSLVGHGMFAHPCLLDGILQASAGLFLDSLATTPARMPFTVGRVDFLRRLPGRVRVVIGRSDQSNDDTLLRLDFAVYSEEDELLMTLRGLQSRPAQSALQTTNKSRKTTHMIYQQSYKTEIMSNTDRGTRIPNQNHDRLVYLIVGQHLDSMSQRLADALARQSRVIQLDELDHVPSSITSIKRTGGDLRAMVIDVRALVGAHGVEGGVDAESEEALALRTLNFYSQLCQADPHASPDFIVHVTSGLVNVQPQTTKGARGASLVGMARAFSVEQYHLPIKIAALDIQDSDHTDLHSVVEELDNLVSFNGLNGSNNNVNSFVQVGLYQDTRSTPITALAPIDPEYTSGFEAGQSALSKDEKPSWKDRISNILAKNTRVFLEKNRTAADRFAQADTELQTLCTQLMADAAQRVARDEVKPHLLGLWQRYRSRSRPLAFDAADLVDRVGRLDADLLGPQVNLLLATAPHLSDVLTGRVDPLTLLFSDRNAQAAAELYKSTFLAKHFNGLVADAVRQIIQSSKDSLPPNYTIQILEVGAGTGGTASFVLPVLATLGLRVHYTFTDLSSSLLARAKKMFARYDFVSYRTLNVEHPCEPQGFAPESFDFILATNVLHATSDLRVVVSNVTDLLLPGGCLIVSELSTVQPFADCTFGLTTGWNAHSGEYRREGPLLRPDTWFELFRTVPGLSPLGYSPQEGIFANQAILTATKDTVSPWSPALTRQLATGSGTRHRMSIRSDATYLVTGGLGGLGILTAKVMVELGARFVVLISRSGKPASGSDGDWNDLSNLCQANNVQLVTRACDVSDRWQVQELIRYLGTQHGLPPIRGVVHGAGVLSDGTFPAQTPESYHLVLKTKAHAARILKQHLGASSLDFFISYSSVAGLLGAPGQSNHTVANELLDRAAEFEWADSPCLSVQWGAVSQIGDAARRGAADEDKRKSTVHEAIPKDTAVLLIRKLFTVAWQRPVVTFVPFLWQNLWNTGNKFASEQFAAFRPGQYLVWNETPSRRGGHGPVPGNPTPQRTQEKDQEHPQWSKLATTPSAPTTPEVDVVQIVQDAIDHVLGRDIEGDETFAEAGVDSLGAIDFRNYLQSALRGLRLSATLLFEYPTKSTLLDYLHRQVKSSPRAPITPAADTVAEPTGSIERRLPTKTPAVASRIVETTSGAKYGLVQYGLRCQSANTCETVIPTARDVAIVGLACQLPCAESPDEFWELLSKDPSTAFGQVPCDRFKMSDWLDPAGRQRGKSYTDAGAFMRDADLFDYEAFNLSAFEAASMDPQQRLLLQVSLGAFADAGLDRHAIRGANIGVYVGAMNFDAAFGGLDDRAQQQTKSASSAAPSLLSSRLSHVSGLQGPSTTVDTACSSSLVAMESAVDALRAGKIDYALVASANCMTSPRTYVAESTAGMLSRRGACVPFDDQADGFVRGEGVVAVVLQRLDLAETRGSEIHAVVGGIATNHNGRTAANLTSPSPSAQASVIRAALSDAGVEPGQVSYVEAHGTGTKLGDPIELGALQDVFDDAAFSAQGQQPPLFVGAVKANVGHLESAAGLVGVLKTLLVLKHGKVPPLSHITESNRHLHLDRGGRVTLPKYWETLQGRGDAIFAGVSSFGFSGVNSHVILRRHTGGPRSNQRTLSPPVLQRSWLPFTAVPAAAGVEIQTGDKNTSASLQAGINLAEKLPSGGSPLLVAVELMAIVALEKADNSNNRSIVLHDGHLRSTYDFTARALEKAHACEVTPGLIGLVTSFGASSATLATARSPASSKTGPIPSVPIFSDHREHLDVEHKGHLPPGVSRVYYDSHKRRVHFTYVRPKEQLYISPSHAELVDAAVGVLIRVLGLPRDTRPVAFRSWNSVPGSSKFDVGLTLSRGGDGTASVDIVARAPASKSLLHVTDLELVDVVPGLIMAKTSLVPLIRLSDLENRHNDQRLSLRAVRRVGAGGRISPGADEAAFYVPRDLPSLAEISQRWVTEGYESHLVICCNIRSEVYAPARALVQTFRLEQPGANISLLSHGANTAEADLAEILRWLPLDLAAEIDVSGEGWLRLPAQMPIPGPSPVNTTPSRTPLQPSWTRGCFILTGGTGGLGLAAAEALLDAGAGHVALLSRSGKATKGSEERLARLVQFAGGRRVSIHQADVTDHHAVIRAVGHIQSRYGPIMGVLHAAGQLSSAQTPSKGFSNKCYGDHYSVKVKGLRSILSAVHDKENIQFVIGFSSTSAALGLRCQAEYAAANAAMDQVLVEQDQQPRLRRQQTRYLSLHIDAVAGVGFAADILKNSEQDGLIPLERFKEAIIQAARDAPSGVIDLSDDKSAALWLSRQGVKESRVLDSELVQFIGTGQPQPAVREEKTMPLQGVEQSVRVRDFIYSAFKEVTGTPLTGDSTPFMDAGLDSLTSVSFRHVLEDKFGTSLPTSLAFDYPNQVLLNHFLQEQTGAGTNSTTATDVKTEPQMMPSVGHSISEQNIVVAGMDCVFPGADGVEAFWNVLMSGQDMFKPISPDRLDIQGYNVGQGSQVITVKEAAMLTYDQIFSFDHDFFGMSRREAEATDPAQRLVLRTCFQALHRAGYGRDELQGSRTGVFVGAGPSEWTKALGFKNALTGAGSASSLLANRVSYVLGLTGPSMVVDTACSSSLVALHLARQSIRRGECEAAVVCGVQVYLHPSTFEQVSRSQMVSPSDNRSKPFDARADGYGRGEGCGAVVLLSAAEAARRGVKDPLAVLSGTAVNQDGRSASLTAPNGPSQVAVIKEALADARLLAGDISYVETHGTGTKLGDPIEFNALRSIFGDSRGHQQQHALALGALKGQIGHLEAASGIASLIKAILVFNHAGLLPRNVNYERLNPEITPGSFDFILPQAPTGLAHPHHRAGDAASTGVLHAGINSFGFGGTNAHAVISSARPADDSIRGAGQDVDEWAMVTRSLDLRQERGENEAPSLPGSSCMRAPYRYTPGLVDPPAAAKHPRRQQSAKSSGDAVAAPGGSSAKRMTFRIRGGGFKAASTTSADTGSGVLESDRDGRGPDGDTPRVRTLHFGGRRAN